METRIAYVDSTNVQEIDWPSGDLAQRARRYFEPMIRHGATGFIENVHVSTAALVVDDQVLPLVVSEGNPDDAAVCSIYAHYVGYPLGELKRLEERRWAFAARAFLSLLGPIVRLGRLGKVVYVNNWLFNTNPPTSLSREQLTEVTRHLEERFPSRAIVFRSINERTSGPKIHSLRSGGYELVRSRRIYLFDPRVGGFLPADNLRRDLRLLSRWKGIIRELQSAERREILRLSELYIRLYLGKYSAWNPRLTEAFFDLVTNQDVVRVFVIERGDDIVAFAAWFEDPTGVNAELVGYDLGVPRAEGLLRMAFALMFRDAIEGAKLLHLSAGNGGFKRLRGAEPTVEYDAVYFRHLGHPRRTAWRSFKCLMDLAERFEGDTAEKRRAP